MLGVTFSYCYAEHHQADCRYAKRRYAECHGAKGKPRKRGKGKRILKLYLKKVLFLLKVQALILLNTC
jgi:hypothetical protein